MTGAQLPSSLLLSIVVMADFAAGINMDLNSTTQLNSHSKDNLNNWTHLLDLKEVVAQYLRNKTSFSAQWGIIEFGALFWTKKQIFASKL